MIRVRLPEPPHELVDKGAVELEKARAHFGNAANAGKPFAFGAYKLGPVNFEIAATVSVLSGPYMCVAWPPLLTSS